MTQTAAPSTKRSKIANACRRVRTEWTQRERNVRRHQADVMQRRLGILLGLPQLQPQPVAK